MSLTFFGGFAANEEVLCKVDLGFRGGAYFFRDAKLAKLARVPVVRRLPNRLFQYLLVCFNFQCLLSILQQKDTRDDMVLFKDS